MEANNLRILVIDDNRDDQTALRAAVASRLPEARFFFAVNGPQGLVLARAEDPDVILLDIVLPGLDGYAICRELKADERLRAIPVIFLTDLRTDRDSRIKALDSGAEGFLSRPVDDVELIAQIRAMAKIKAADRLQQQEQGKLAALVTERTRDLEQELVERKRVESALRESETIFERFLEFSPIYIFFKDEQIRALRLSRNFETMLGKPLAELLGKSMDDLFPSELARSMVADDQCIMKEGKAVTVEEELNGRFYATTKFPIDIEGKPRYLAGYTIDITERKSAEEALRRERDRAQSYLDTVETIIVALDSEGRIAAINRKGCELFGRSEDELRGRLWFSTCLPQSEDVVAVDRVFRRLMAGELEPVEYFENPVVSQSGELRQIAWHNTLLRDAQGRITGTLSSGEDITERKRAEAERDRLSAAIEQTDESIVISDPDGTMQYVNPAFERTTGYSREEAVGRTPRLLRSGVQDKEFYRELWATITAGRVWEGRFVNRRKDGSFYTDDTTISPVHDAAGRIVNYVAVKRDITEHLRSAEEKARLQDQLRQSQKVEAIGRLAGGVAHDFNNLTAIVLGYGEMLLGQFRADDPGRKWVEQIVEAGRRSATLTRQLLAFSRRQVLLPKVLDLNALLRDLEKMLGRLIGEDIELALKLAAAPGRITADPGQIEQVVTNLVLNARDAMPRGGRLTIETANVELDQADAQGHESIVPGRYVLLALTDTGCGMDKATMTRLFEPFFTTKERGKGTGLGLATAYGIVKQSGGYIWADSEPGEGTTFKIYLPWTDAELKSEKDEPGGETPRGRGEQILLVEDEAPLRELCVTVLSRLGYRVSSAESGPEALALVQEQGLAPDLVVTDVIMPGMSGAEMAERLHRDRSGLKVLYMSGYPDDAIARHGGLDSHTPFIQKPFTERALAVKVREVLGREATAVRPGRRVLMIDDDEQFRELVRHFCTKRGLDLTGVDTAPAALTALAGQPYDVLLVDLNIPGTSGMAVLREIRAAGHATPAIVLTGDVASADMDELRPLGALRALEKSSDGGPLLQAIEAAAENPALQRERRP